ncbi:MAG: polyprenyl synthetase family protein [Bacteroidales bacterium]|nr:polyprenyl synthetase family protein [Bacteroidales bacterium]
MDYLSLIKKPIGSELNDFISLFNQSLTHEDGLLGSALAHIRQRGGKRMRPMLILLTARNYGVVSDVTLHGAVGLELLHTASLVHDDVVDESSERRGQASVNATYDNKVAVLVGDYILSTALLNVSFTGHQDIIQNLAELGRTLSNGEILQLTNIQNQEISEEVYYQVIRQKTAALFESCSAVGALSVGATSEQVEQAKKFGQNIGIIFQIRDDIFDYYDSKEIGKPTGNDMAEGQLTLPVIYALNKYPLESMLTLAKKVKSGTVNADEIAVLVEFAKTSGGIEYAEQRMNYFADEARKYIDAYVTDDSLKAAFNAYLEFVIQRNN